MFRKNNFKIASSELRLNNKKDVFLETTNKFLFMQDILAIQNREYHEIDLQNLKKDHMNYRGNAQFIYINVDK